MSGDWMKVELDTADKPEVQYIAGTLGIDPDAVLGKLFRVWAWFDKHTENGNAVGVTYSFIDRITNVTGFAEAMALAGWLSQSGHTLVLPKFDRHNGKTAKNRALTNERVAKSRILKRESNDECNAPTVTKTVTREEKRREEKKKETTSVGFADFWAAYPRKIAKGEAEKAWSKLKPSPGLTTKIVSAVNAAAGCEQWARDGGKFIPHPATWLNGKRWEDEGAPAKINGGQVWDLPNVDPLEIAKGRVFGDAA